MSHTIIMKSVMIHKFHVEFAYYLQKHCDTGYFYPHFTYKETKT